MLEALTSLFDPTGFTPRANCGTAWTPGLIALNATSDLFIWLAYVSIPLVLLYFTRRRDLPFPRVFVLFALFILACGTTHLIDALIFKYPIYRFAGLMKAVTAVVSWATVITLIQLIPKVVPVMAEAAKPGADTKTHVPITGEARGASVRGYIVALLAAVLALLVRAAVDSLVTDDHILVVALLAVVYVSWQYGFRPAVLALLVSLVGYGYFFMPPRRTFLITELGDQLSLSLFFFCGVACAALGEAHRVAQRRAKSALAVALGRQEELESEVTRRRVVEAALRQREAELVAARGRADEALARLDAFIDNAPVGIVFFDPELRYERINAFLAASNGKPVADHIGRTLEEVIPQFPADLTAKYREIANGRAGPFSGTSAGPSPRDGAYRAYHVTAFPVRRPDGATLGAGVVVHDITEQRKAEDEVRHSNERFRRTLDEIAVPLILYADDDEVLMVNKAWTEVTGYTRAEVPTIAAWTERAYGDRRGAARAYIDRLYDATGRVDDGEWTVTTAAGARRLWHFYTTPVGREPSGRRLLVSNAVDVTEARRAEEAVRTSEARFRAVVESVPGHLWTAAPDGAIDYAGPWMPAYTGVPAERLYGAAWTDVVHPDDRPAARDRWARSVATGEPYSTEYRIRGADGAYRWFATHAVARRGPDGAVERWYGYTADVNDRVEAEGRMRDSEARFRTLAHAVPHIIWVTRPDGFHEYYNRRWYEYTGLTEEQSLGWGWAGPLHPDDKARAEARWKQSTDTGDEYEIEYRFRGADGAYRWFLGRALPQYDDRGRVVRWYGTCTDIDDERRATEAVRRNEERYRTLTEAVPNVIWNADPDGRVTYLNRRWDEYTGLLGTEARGDGWLGAVHPDDRPRVAAAWRGTVERPEPGPEDRFAEEFRLRHAPSDGYRWFQSVAVPLRHPDGRVDQWIGSMADIHDQKTAVDTIRGLNDRLRDQAAELQTILDAAPAAIWITRDTGCAVITGNRTAADLLRARPADNVSATQPDPSGRGFRELDPDGRPIPPDRLPMQVAARDGVPVLGAELLMAFDDGRVRHLLGNAVPLPGPDGAARGAVSVFVDVTEQKRAEAEMRQSEAFRQSVFDNSPDCLKVFDLEGQLLEMNQTGCELMELDSVDALRGSAWAEAWPPANRETIREAVAAARAGRVSRFQGFCPTAKGTPRYWDVSVAPLPGVDGQPYRLLGVSRDITEQRRAEERIRESEELFRQMAESIPQLAWMTDPDGYIFWYNQRWYDYTGTTLEEMKGWGWEAVHDPNELPRVVERFKAALAAGEPWEDTFPLRGADGRFRWFLSRARPIRDQLGNIIRWFGTNTDISAQRELEHTLRASEERFRTLTETVPQIVWTADPKGEVTFFNRRWVEYTGVPLAAGRAEGWGADLLHPEDADRLRVGWQLAVAQGAGSYSEEFRLRRAADGEYRWFLSNALPLRDPDGGVEEWVGTLTDIDDQKRQSAVLARMVRERTKALERANAALTDEVKVRQAAETQARTVAVELARSNGELEKFAYVASHDLQEPLRKIQAFGDRLTTKCRDALPDKGKEYIDRMQVAAARMRRLIDDLLKFSRVTSQQRPFGRLDLRKLVGEVLSDLEVRIGQARGTVRVGPLPAIDADATQMRQLFQNLIANAVKFQRPGVPPVVQIEGEVVDLVPPGAGDGAAAVPTCRITVRDNGIGFDDKYRDRIFEVFQRLHGRDEYEGTGVGLAICRKIAERHGGAIEARGRPDEGATFVVTLPVRQANSTEGKNSDAKPDQADHDSDGR